MCDHIQNRDTVLKMLREELVGPCMVGEEIDCNQIVYLPEVESAYKPYRQLGSGEEILQRDSPTKRYGIGVLYPMEAPVTSEEVDRPLPELDSDIGQRHEKYGDIFTSSAIHDCEMIASRLERSLPEANSDDLDISSANAYRPSSMAVSLLVYLPEGAELSVVATGGRYREKAVTLINRDGEWWLRSPVQLKSHFRRFDFPTSNAYVKAYNNVRSNVEDLDVKIKVFSRPYNNPDEFLITVCLVNCQQPTGRIDSQCLFQANFEVQLEPGSTKAAFLPYPASEPLDEEEYSQELLYRNKLTFAVGHGCAADWLPKTPTTFASMILAECLPVVELSKTTPDICSSNGEPLVAYMRPLTGVDSNAKDTEQLERIVSEYEAWITTQRSRISSLSERLQKTANFHIDRCSEAAQRMRDGLALLVSDQQVRQAFQLANLAMLMQQVRSRREARVASFDKDASRLLFAEPYESLDLDSETARKSHWRAFQIAFILASLRSTADPADDNREQVELIWFPTGGGKTEAYLGLAAFSIFLRRLRNPDDIGVHALMRYTLRLLTAQQFQRASRLICAMEYIRQQHITELGKDEISIGLWLGGSTTPNRRDEALAVLRSLCRGEGINKFVLDRCPWCGAQMGPVNLQTSRGRGRSNIPRVIGYRQVGKTFAYACPDYKCNFHSSLPLYAIDEDIYEKRPDLIIGTVDKFAMLAWRPQARSLFGMNKDGQRAYSPPGLIIQDELHLISGPLGSMAGLYEPVIEELCTDRRGRLTVKPKIVSSTATIRSYADQVRGLFARERTRLFPPPGLDADDSFFARIERQPDGTPERGRIYVGVHAPGLGSLQTVQVRTFSALLQAPSSLPLADQDPWWTLLLFFNSLRELGTTLTLFQSDVPDLLKGSLRQRYGMKFPDVRKLRKILELTGRLPGDEVAKAISQLEIPTESQHGQPVDVCLASNIIEVGVDIDRLSLMTVVGQPKTTSQYIQVTGRVGRKSDRPGLVVTIYAASKPRDRSHFEKFRSYHEQLYAQVEPTSVTPFSRPALERAVHAVMVSYVRQFGSPAQAKSPHPFPASLLAEVENILVQRASIVDPSELAALQRIIQRRYDEWQHWQRLEWDKSLNDEDVPLMRPAGAYVTQENARISWPTPQSLRNVDVECQAEITQLYMTEGI